MHERLESEPDISFVRKKYEIVAEKIGVWSALRWMQIRAVVDPVDDPVTPRPVFGARYVGENIVRIEKEGEVIEVEVDRLIGKNLTPNSGVILYFKKRD